MVVRYLLYTLLFVTNSVICFSQDAIQIHSGNFRLHTGAKLGLFGDLTNNGTMTSNLGEMHLVGTTLQTINGSSKVQGNNITLNNSNHLKVDNQFEISGILTFTAGDIQTDEADVLTEFVNFLDGSTYSGATDAKHIDGVVRKTGDDAFIFPVGDSADLQPIAISDPGATITDHYTAYYQEVSPATPGYTRTSKVVAINHVSNCEYWILNRTGGTSNVDVTLDFDANSCGVTDLSELLVVRWDGSTWQNNGNGGTTGTISSGTVQTSAVVTAFSPFTLGSSAASNPLPIELLSFEVEKKQNYANITWVTATEINNDYFEVEKSLDTHTWEIIHRENGAGNSSSTLVYTWQDDDLIDGIQYYRLKQTDFDGKFTYSEIRIIDVKITDSKLSIYPNPSKGIVYISGKKLDLESYQLFNSLGQNVSNESKSNSTNADELIMDFSNLSKGIYFLKVNKYSQRIIIN